MWATDEITCLGNMLSPNVGCFAAFEYGLLILGIGFVGVPFSDLWSSTSFGGYSYAYMQWTCVITGCESRSINWMLSALTDWQADKPVDV